MTATLDLRTNGRATYIDPPKKVLLIEDNPADARLVSILLLDTDLISCKITHAETLTEAINIIETGERFDAVLCDLTLPDSRGFETLERLLARCPDQNVIVQTGLADKNLGLQAVRAGAQDFLVKGAYDGDLLGKTLRYAIERRTVLERLEETQRLAHIGHWEANLATGIMTASDEFFRILGMKPDKHSMSIEEFEQASHPLWFLNTIHAETEETGKVARDVEVEKSIGGSCYVSIKCRREPDSQALHGIMQDITQRKQSDELRKQHEVSQQAAAMKEQFIASVSHEMRTPMNAILGMSNLVLHTPLNEEQRNYISSVKQSSEILLGIVNDILEISTLKNGSIAFENKAFDLHELLANLVNVMSYKINEKHLEFNLEIEEDVPRILSGDKLRLNQILYNLVGNAIKFTDEGSVTVYVKALNYLPNQVKLEFSIQDTGIGIPADQLDAVFESFTRVRHKDRLFEGTGLGLSIARGLVHQQEGKMGLESKFGEGSRFYFSLTFGVSDEDALDAGKNRRKSGNTLDPSTHFNLLLVEDHKMNQLVAKKTLERQFPNIKISIAENGRQAIDLLEKQEFSIVLMDLQMPVMDGQEATKYIREQMPAPISTIPILAMTAHAHISKDEQFKDYGMDDFVLKPFEPEQLFEKISINIRLNA
jgi:signal transduction histidine kinase